MLKVTDVINQMDMLNNVSDVLYDLEKQEFINVFYEEIDENKEDEYVVFFNIYELDDYNSMVDFVKVNVEKKYKQDLYDILNEKKVYRKFKDKCIELDIIKNWYNFKEKIYYEKAIEWLKKNNIEYIDDYGKDKLL